MRSAQCLDVSSICKEQLLFLYWKCYLKGFFWKRKIINFHFQTDSLHIDLRPLNEIQFYESSHMVRIGAGATWGQVLDVVDPKKYTLIHGNVSIFLAILITYDEFEVSTKLISPNLSK